MSNTQDSLIEHNKKKALLVQGEFGLLRGYKWSKTIL